MRSQPKKRCARSENVTGTRTQTRGPHGTEGITGGVPLPVSTTDAFLRTVSVTEAKKRVPMFNLIFRLWPHLHFILSPPIYELINSLTKHLLTRDSRLCTGTQLQVLSQEDPRVPSTC